MFISFSHICVVTDTLACVMIVVAVDMSPDMEIIVMAIPTIALEFVGVAYVADVLADVLEAVIIGAVPAIDADMLAGENVNGLVTP